MWNQNVSFFLKRNVFVVKEVWTVVVPSTDRGVRHGH